MADGAQRDARHRSELLDVATVFLRLGLTAFGGPAAHIAIMENEVVERRRWLTSERFLDLVGTANLIPGPSSTELALFIGYERAGWQGLVLGGVCFVLPAAVMVTALAWAYVHFGAMPQVAGVLYGIKPVVIAVVAQAVWGLAPKAVKRSYWLGALGVVACIASWFGVDALVVLIGAGAASVARTGLERGSGAGRAMLLGGFIGGSTSVAMPFSLATLFLTFFKVGAMVFGSGYVLLAFLQSDLVDRLHWLTEKQLLDAIAIGQVTPGPVFTRATFIGYVLGGGWAALIATLGIFLPGFLLVAVSRRLVARIRQSEIASVFLDGVNVAALALMAVVAVQLGRTAVVDCTTAVLAMASLVLLVQFRVNTTWLVAGGAIAGTVAATVGPR